jgi:MFS family permease
LRIFGSVAFLDFIDAIEMSFLGIFLSILATEWNLSRGQLTLLGVSFYLGSLIGHLCCAFFADLIGRKNLLVIGSCCTFLTMLINSQV